MADEDRAPRDRSLDEEETITMAGVSRPPAPSGPEPPTQRMVRGAAADATGADPLDDDWDVPEDLPELAGTAKMPVHVERRALPFRRGDGGGRQTDARSAAPPPAETWAQAGPSLDPSQLPSALAPSERPAPSRPQRDDDGESARGVLAAFGVFVLLALVLLAVAALGV